ncbi:MAG: GDSL-type esterase/lipase family protein [Clostridiales bacterium]|nr:GDSL-type esterase/lipase family protein [Clostridiales bacterium]
MERQKSKTTLKQITVFIGDSLSVGLYPSSYNGQQFLKMSGDKLIYAHGGVNSSTIQTSKVFQNKTKTGLQKVIDAKPCRVYIMLGMNEVRWRSLDDVSASYKKMIDTIKKKSPYTDIVLLAMTPVTKSKASKSPNFKKVGAYNKNLKKIAKENDVAYYDFTSEFVTSDGYLKSSYCGSADGIHWNINTYREFGKLITEYDSNHNKMLRNK